MKLRLITYVERDLWDAFVAGAANSPILQSFAWGELKSHFGWKPLRIAVEDGGKIIAGASILIREIPFFRHAIFYSPRGPIVNFHNREILEFLLGAVENEAEKNQAVALKIDPDISEGDQESLNCLRSYGFEKALKQVQPRVTSIIDLTRNEEELIMGFEEKCRYNIRLAEKKGVTVIEDNTEKGIKIFYKLYRQTALRGHFLIHPLSYYQKVRDLLIDKGMGSNFIAYYEGKPIAGVIVFCFGERVWYMYGASSSEYRNVMPNHLLHWSVIKWAKEKKYKHYDLWGIPAKPQEKHPLWGVYRFKKGFNGKEERYIGAQDLPFSPLLFSIFEHGVSFWQNFRSLITKGKIEDSLGE